MKILYLHNDPPSPCLYGMEYGLRQAGHEVIGVGYRAEGELRDAFYNLPESEGCAYHAPRAPDEHIDSIMKRVGGGGGFDMIWYVQPELSFLPKGLYETDIPTVCWLTEEYKFERMDRLLYPLFDVAPTCMPDCEGRAPNRPVRTILGLQWLRREGGEWADREFDVAFSGWVGVNGITERRDAALVAAYEALTKAGGTFKVHQGAWLEDQARLYGAARYVWTHSGQGKNNLTFRVGEAMASGAVPFAQEPKYGVGPLPCVKEAQWASGTHYLTYEGDSVGLEDFARRVLGREGQDCIEAASYWLANNSCATQMQFMLDEFMGGVWKRREGVTGQQLAHTYMKFFGRAWI